MKSVLCLAVVAAMNAAALAQDEMFKEYELGQRIEVTFKAGHTLRGELCKPRGWDKYDLQKDVVVAINVTLEYLRLDGQVAFEKQTIKSVKKLPALSPDQVQKILAAKSKALSQLNREEQARIQAQLEKFEQEKKEFDRKLDEKLDKAAGGELEGEADKLKRARAIYEKYPESAGWGQSKYDTLSKFLIPSGQKSPKYLDIRESIIVGPPRTQMVDHDNNPATPPIAQPIPGTEPKNYAPAKPDESEFYEKFDLWLIGRNLANQPEMPQPKPEPEKQPEPPKPEPEPTPEVEKKGGS